VQALRCASWMAAALGLRDAERDFHDEAQTRIIAINRLCWDEERGAYVDTVRDEWAYRAYLALCGTMSWEVLSWDQYRNCGRVSEQTNTLALLYRCVPADRMPRMAHIAERVALGKYAPSSPAQRAIRVPTEHEAPDGIVRIGSPFFLFFSLTALFQEGKGDMAIENIRREWNKMSELDLRTCPEGFGWPRSAAHAWSASPAVLLPIEVLGIHPLEPGFASFSVTPCPGELTWARGSVATPHGPIQVAWSRDSQGKLEIQCSAPAACQRVE
jgi:alpha-L-rhamnosidase